MLGGFVKLGFYVDLIFGRKVIYILVIIKLILEDVRMGKIL